MLSINNLPDYEYRANETAAERAERRLRELRARPQALNVTYITNEDRFGGRRESQEHRRNELVRLYEGAIVGVEYNEGSFYGRRIKSFMVEGIEHLPLTLEVVEKNPNGIYGATTIKIYKIASMQPTMSHAHTEVHHEHTAFGTKTTTVHVEETYAPHRPTVTMTVGRPARRETYSTEEAVGTLAGALLGMAMVGLSRSRR
jgi:hypothetical protein